MAKMEILLAGRMFPMIKKFFPDHTDGWAKFFYLSGWLAFWGYVIGIVIYGTPELFDRLSMMWTGLQDTSILKFCNTGDNMTTMGICNGSN